MFEAFSKIPLSPDNIRKGGSGLNIGQTTLETHWDNKILHLDKSGYNDLAPYPRSLQGAFYRMFEAFSEITFSPDNGSISGSGLNTVPTTLETHGVNKILHVDKCGDYNPAFYMLSHVFF